MGLSPRVRGNRLMVALATRQVRSIPAGAGEPYVDPPYGNADTVYPRGCGGTPPPRLPEHGRMGLSPRVRGNPFVRAASRRHRGSIPAGAGEPRCRRGRWRSPEVYPRGCGGTPGERAIVDEAAGLSPRVRGNLGGGGAVDQPHGSIPAGAGEPAVLSSPCLVPGVYPRGCGGTRGTNNLSGSKAGLSPRVRGNPERGESGYAPHRSIPAGAGEPALWDDALERSKVYPRGCGGTLDNEARPFRIRGLSPRVRGNRSVCSTALLCTGSIPAGAGEPSRNRRGLSSRRVYPRGCGGTDAGTKRFHRVPGLSPRVRGNPRSQKSLQRLNVVYPRGCGGTDSGACQPPGSKRSIPAGAGEPRRGRRLTSPRRVYPRGCGGTPCAPPPIWMSCGSIPAGAGEPLRGQAENRQGWVYPRGCGGTEAAPMALNSQQGLSPRVRGNQSADDQRRAVPGSIPAGAGEPRCTPPPRSPTRVYPRGCGGTARAETP